MEKPKYSSRWEIILSLFIGQDNVFSKEAMCFQNELKNMRLLHSCSSLRQTLLRWLDSLEETERSNSVQLREKGNKILKEEKNYFQALKYYTKAIYAAQESVEASLAHANRAYVLLQKGFFQETYDDCEYALNLGYPKSKEFKVLLRQVECSIFLDNAENLKQCIRKFEERNTTKESSSKVSDKLMELRAKLRSLPESIIDTTVKPPRTEKKQILCNSPTKGTFVIAGQKILKDEAIMYENAFAFVPLYGSKDRDHVDCSCHNCGQSNIIPFPCNTCRRVSYCSIKCHDFHEPIHKLECWGFKRLLFRDIGIAHLALRALIVGYSDMLLYLDDRSDGDQYSYQKLWKDILDFAKDDNMPYAHVIRLSSNLERMNSEDFLRYALTASMLICYLRNFTQFFDKTKDLAKIKMPEIDWEIAFGALLLRHIGQMVCNAHSITGMKILSGSSDFWKSKDVPNIGTLHQFHISKLFAAIYPRVSLYNHSCEPNFYNNFNKTNLTVKAVKDLQVKDEIFNCYGINFKSMDKATRKAALKAQYAFDCDCKHCGSEDTEFKRYHTYLCTNINCKKEFTLDSNNYYWWEQPKATFIFKCSFCESHIDWQWYQQFEAITCTLPELGESKIKWFSSLCEHYHNSQWFLTDVHELKQKMATTILSEFIDLPYDSSRNEAMINISKDLLNAFEDQYGAHSPKFVYGATYFLDLLAIKISKGDKVKSYNMKKILNSFQTLPDKEKKVFENYVKMYIEIG